MTETRMSIKEAKRLGIMKEIDKKRLTLKGASQELGLSLRQTKRVRKRYREVGDHGVISLKQGMPSPRKLPLELRDKAVELVRQKYPDFGPTLACEKLERVENIKISHETLRKWLIEEGIWKCKRAKQKRVHQRRERRKRFGELIQIDGSPHAWFEKRGDKCCLLMFVDDATSRVTAARFVPVENAEGYKSVLKEHLMQHGLPRAIYSDRHSIFKINREEMMGNGLTHFGQILKDLDIELICANSPQAKGRVERKNGLFQDRLVKEMRLRNISTQQEGNEYLPEFIEEMNHRFSIKPAEAKDGHKRLTKNRDLTRVFALKQKRKLTKNLTMQYKNEHYMIQTKIPNRLQHARVDVIETDTGVTLEYHGNKLEYKKWSEMVYEGPQVVDSKALATYSYAKRKHKPGKHHPWR